MRTDEHSPKNSKYVTNTDEKEQQIMSIILNEVTKSILARRTVRSFTPEPLTEDEKNTLLECAMWSPSARNAQKCYIRVVSDKAALDELNRDFKDVVGWDAPAYTRWDVNPVYQTAPSLFFIFADGPDPMNGGIMAENICIAAQGLGLNSCIIGSVGALFETEKGEKWKERLNVPSDGAFVVSVAVGHGNEDPEPKPRNREKFYEVKI